jgi:hypothetical protein
VTRAAASYRIPRSAATSGGIGPVSAPPRTFPPAGRLFDIAVALVVVLLVVVSPLALVELGLAYDEAGGTAIEKIHPGTLLATLVLLAATTTQGNPLGWLASVAARSPALAVYLVAIVLLMAHTILVVKLPFTPLIDTFVAPLIVFVLLRDLPDDRGRTLALLLHGLLLANAVVGIGEFATGTRLTPLVAAGVVIEDDWRSTALLGHPLANASLTGAYLLMLALGGGRDLPHMVRPLAFILGGAGMVVFGGRAATVLLVLILAALAAGRIRPVLAGARFDPRSVLVGLLLAPFAGIVLIGLGEAGFFDQFAERFIDDKGSAEARSEMFELFRHISWHDLILGPDARQLETLRALYGLDFGIESFWIAYILTNGIVVALMFFAALLAFCREIQRAVRPGGFWVLVFFFLVASTSVSLSAKSPLLAVLTLMMLILLRTAPGDTARRHAPGGPQG